MLLAGCGGSAVPAGPISDAGKVEEFLGDGGGAAKPLPAFLEATEAESDKRLPTPLRPRQLPLRASVPEGRVNWFDAELSVGNAHYVCLVQPPAPTSNMADPDLYVLYPLDVKAALRVPPPSRRAPSGGNNPPDWVAWDVRDPGVHQIAVVGYSAAGASPADVPFDVELDQSRKLQPGGSALGVHPREGKLRQRDSNWFHFRATAGVRYTVTLRTLSGDADLYVYGATSSDFIGQSLAGGTSNDEVQFVATANGMCHVRVYGYQESDYRIRVNGGSTSSVVRRAVLVGVADYVGSANDLSYCDKDARDFGNALAAWGNWNAANIQVIVNRDATAANIWNALNAMSAASDADDQCVFFFSGHGTRGADIAPLDEGDGLDEYLCETDLTNNIRDDQLGEWVANLPTSNVLIVLCACYSAGAFKGSEAIKGIGPGGEGLDGFVEEIRSALAAKVQTLDVQHAGAGVVLAACDDNETCQESSALQHDVFNHYVLEAMAGAGDANGDNIITAEEIFAYANPRATSYNPRQHAQIYDALPAVPFVLLQR